MKIEDCENLGLSPIICHCGHNTHKVERGNLTTVSLRAERGNLIERKSKTHIRIE